MHSKALILLLFIHCLLLLLLHVGVLCCVVLKLGSLFCGVICVISSFAIIWLRKRELAVVFYFNRVVSRVLVYSL